MSEGRAEPTSREDVQGTRTFHAGDQPIAEAVVEATAAVLNDDPLTLDPLYDTVDPDALGALVGDEADGCDVTVGFRFEGCRVTVERGGRIHIER
jgi:hypothetical protein